jgi:hypothetical protein
MGIYYHPEQPPIVPDGFLSLSVERVQERDRSNRLAAKLRALGIDPDAD